MRRRTAWKHWWAIAAIAFLALVATTASYGEPHLEGWALALVGAGLVLVVISMVVNRPRPRRPEWEPVVDVRDQRAAIAAVRRGAAVGPPAQQRQAIDAVRREWFAVGLQLGVVSTVAANLIRQENDDPRGLVDTAIVVFGHLILVAVMIGIAYFGLVLRRVDELESRCGT